MERIQKIIAQSGYCSRRKAEELLKKGLVSVNGKVITEMGYKASFNDYIEVEGNSIMDKQDNVYYLLNKPRGIITSTKDDKAKIEGLITKGNLKNLESGVIIDGKKTSKSKAKILKMDKKTNTTVVELTIHEGRNHQVKNMFKALGYSVLKLKREKISFLTTEGLPSGTYRQLSIHEVKKLYNETKKVA